MSKNNQGANQPVIFIFGYQAGQYASWELPGLSNLETLEPTKMSPGQSTCARQDTVFCFRPGLGLLGPGLALGIPELKCVQCDVDNKGCSGVNCPVQQAAKNIPGPQSARTCSARP